MQFAYTHTDLQGSFPVMFFQGCFPLLISVFLPAALNPPLGTAPHFPTSRRVTKQEEEYFFFK